MSKSVYDEALRLTEIKIDNENMYVKDKKVYHATFDLEVIELINNALELAIKQEKLLELYRKHYKLVPFMPGLGDNAKTVIDNSRKIEQIEKKFENE